MFYLSKIITTVTNTSGTRSGTNQDNIFSLINSIFSNQVTEETAKDVSTMEKDLATLRTEQRTSSSTEVIKGTRWQVDLKINYSN